MTELSVVHKPPARGTTAAQIAHLLQARIDSGELAAGAQLPTVRELAQELGVNKNTVVRAYQALEREGLVEVVQGRGAFVRPPASIAGGIDTAWQARLDGLLQEARRQGVTRELALGALRGGVERVYGRDTLRIAFVECNDQDTDEMGGQLGELVGHALQGVLLDDLLARPDAIAASYDLIVTTFYHLAEVTRALPAPDRERIIGVHAMPSHDSLLKIARLNVLVIGLVCEVETTVNNLVHTIHTYHPSATLLPALFDDQARVQTVLSKADALVVTRSCADRVQALVPAAPVIVVAYTIDQQSIDFLRQRIREQQGAAV